MPPNNLHKQGISAMVVENKKEVAMAAAEDVKVGHKDVPSKVLADAASKKEKTDTTNVDGKEETIVDSRNGNEEKTTATMTSGKEKNDVNLPNGEVVEVFKPKYLSKNVYLYIYVNLASLYGLYSLGSTQWETIVLAVFLYMVGMVGVTAGKHRLWSHRSYKARLPLQLLLAVMGSVDFQFSITTWARDHRAHHKFCESDADPYNPKRGLLFAHAGWLLQKKHPEVKRRGGGLDMEDIYGNPILRFQHRYFLYIGGLACFVIPTLIPTLWGESLINAWHINILRYTTCQHVVSLVNSAAHAWGFKPYDRQMTATQTIPVAILAAGEGFHNYHHTFPSDYRTAELGNNRFNLSTKFIDFFAKIGWAYDLKTTSKDVVRERQKRAGDGTDLWGYANEDKSL